jgi:hypothetical protein
MAYVEASYYHGYAYVMGHSDQELAAIALWLPPGTDLTLMKMVKFGFAKVPVDCGVEACRRWQKLHSAWNDHRLSIMGETPHWYLWSLATNPESLGKGAADTLINVVLEMSDTVTFAPSTRANLLCTYSESDSEAAGCGTEEVSCCRRSRNSRSTLR